MRSVSAQAHIRKGDGVRHPGFRIVGNPRNAPLPDESRIAAAPPARRTELGRGTPSGGGICVQRCAHGTRNMSGSCEPGAVVRQRRGRGGRRTGERRAVQVGQLDGLFPYTPVALTELQDAAAKRATHLKTIGVVQPVKQEARPEPVARIRNAPRYIESRSGVWIIQVGQTIARLDSIVRSQAISLQGLDRAHGNKKVLTHLVRRLRHHGTLAIPDEIVARGNFIQASPAVRWGQYARGRAHAQPGHFQGDVRGPIEQFGPSRRPTADGNIAGRFPFGGRAYRHGWRLFRQALYRHGACGQSRGVEVLECIGDRIAARRRELPAGQGGHGLQMPVNPGQLLIRELLHSIELLHRRRQRPDVGPPCAVLGSRDPVRGAVLRPRRLEELEEIGFSHQ
ncbi:hypothetical protein BN2905_34920 [Achromobacter xylosoxidans]|nr:hypothetical protein BN2905_34920 [Achromobacter xylosoxidans]